MYTADYIIKHFTDALFEGKQTSGTLYKVMSVLADEFSLIEQTLATIIAYRDIDKARGMTLDLIGQNINQKRGKATDEVYRILLKSKIARNLSDGTVNTIIDVISLALSTKPSDVKILESWEVNPDAKPSIELMKLPITKLLESGIDQENFVAIIQKTVAGGVQVKQVELEGTFELGDDYTDDLARGMTDSMEDDYGGILGEIYGSSKNEKLPI